MIQNQTPPSPTSATVGSFSYDLVGWQHICIFLRKCPLSKLWKPNVHPSVIYSCSPLIRVTETQLRPLTEQQPGHTHTADTHSHQQLIPPTIFLEQPQLLRLTSRRKHVAKNERKEGKGEFLASPFIQTMKQRSVDSGIGSILDCRSLLLLIITIGRLLLGFQDHLEPLLRPPHSFRNLPSSESHPIVHRSHLHYYDSPHHPHHLHHREQWWRCCLWWCSYGLGQELQQEGSKVFGCKRRQ